jgi:hypothetical protein
MKPNKMKKKIKQKNEGTINWKPNMKMSFSNTDTVNNWSGFGGYYQCLFDIEWLGIKVVIWKKH